MGKGSMNRQKAKGGGKNNLSSSSSTNPNRVLGAKAKGPKGMYRSKSTIKRLNMYNEKVDEKKRKLPLLKPVRIEPNRKWFGNTRVITQKKLELFRDKLNEAANDPYNVVLKRSKLPMSLLKESTKEHKMHLLSIESFENTFGKNKKRKRPKLMANTLEDMASHVETSMEKYDDNEDKILIRESDGIKESSMEEIFKKGTSKRIWGELYKVVDSSDVIVQVIDARDPMGTRCKHFEAYLKRDRPHKHLILLMNKTDLVPVWAAERWLKILSREYPTVAFHASINHPFGKQPFIQLLRQYAVLLKDRKNISVGFIGYPNVGKSSVINTLRKSKVCKAAPTPGETRVWQYVTLTKRIYLIDCPGVVPNDPDCQDDTSKILKGAIRAERVTNPEYYVDEVLKRVKCEYILKKYGLPMDTTFDDADSFLSLVATKMGKLLKGGEPDISTAARIVLYDWQRGRLPFFASPFTNGSAGDDSVSKQELSTVEETANNTQELVVEQSFDTLVSGLEFNESDMQPVTLNEVTV